MAVTIIKSFKQSIPASELESGKAYTCPEMNMDLDDQIIFIGNLVNAGNRTVVAFSVCGEYVVFKDDPDYDGYVEISLEINADIG